MSILPASELILNRDGSIYHLNLRPEHVADTIITVGDPDRVAQVAKYFDAIEFTTHRREFHTTTGRVGHKRLTVISTGIGPDNIDIVLNELDALVNIDLQTRQLHPQPHQLTLIRLGTSGCLQADVPVDALLFSTHGLGLDNLLFYYDYQPAPAEQQLLTAMLGYLSRQGIHFPTPPYLTAGDVDLLHGLAKADYTGITLTAPGFYGPQGRSLRLASRLRDPFLTQLAGFRAEELRITNFEMETSAIYGLSRLLGHRALSCNVIIANRATKTFSPDPRAAVERMIRVMLERLAHGV